MAFTAGGRFNLITAQGRHLFKKTTFTVSTLPGHGLSLLAPARGTPALPAKGDFSRWSFKPLTVGSQDSCCSRDEQDDLLSSVGPGTGPDLADQEAPPHVTAIRVRLQQTTVYEFIC